MRLLRGMRMLLVAGCVACAVSVGSTENRLSRNAPSVLTARDFAPWRGRNLYEALEGLRPSFLRPNLRGDPPAVLVNGILQPMTVLRQHSAAEVVEVRLLRETDAAARYAVSHTGPVILVTLR